MIGLITPPLQMSRPLNRAVAEEVQHINMKSCMLHAGICYPGRERGSGPISSISVDVERLSVLSTLASIGKLEDGWYGNDSVGISPIVVERAKSVIENSLQAGLPKPDITPTLHGTISVEWESRNASIYLEIGRTKMNGFLRTEGNEPTLISDVAVIPDALYADLSSIISPRNTVSIALQTPAGVPACSKAA